MNAVNMKLLLRRDVILTTLALVCLLMLLLLDHHGLYDLRIYRDSIRYWLNGNSLYGFERGPFRQGFTYPPFAAILLLPTALAPYSLAVFVSYALSIACILWIVSLVGSPLFALSNWPIAAAVAWSSVLAYAMQPYRDTLSFGQINLALLAIVLTDGYAISRASRFAGIGIGLATAIKLTPGIFIIFLFLTGRRRAGIVALAASGSATLLAAAIAPATSWRFWGTAVFDTSRVGLYESTLNQSLAGAIARVADPSPLPTVFWLTAAAAIGALGLNRACRAACAGDLPVALTLTGLTTSLVSPITWVHHLVWVGPAILHLVAAGRRRRQWRWYGAATFFFFFFTLNLPSYFAASPGGHWSHGLIGQVGESSILICVLLLVLVLPWQATSTGLGSMEEPRGGQAPPTERWAGRSPPTDGSLGRADARQRTLLPTRPSAERELPLARGAQIR